MLKGFFYTKRYSFWDMIPISIMGVAGRHGDWAIVGVVFVVAVAMSVTFDWYYDRKK